MPTTEQTTAGCLVFDPEAQLIEALLEEAVGVEGPHLLRCGRSLSVARTAGIEDAHDCFAGTVSGEPSFWCVLSHEEELLASALRRPGKSRYRPFARMGGDGLV